MSSVAKKSGTSKKVARDRRILAAAWKQDGAEKPVSEARIREAAERAGLSEIPTIPRMNRPDEPDEHGETHAARAARLDAEYRMLTCAVPGSLGAKVRQLLGQGLWVDPDAPDVKNARTMSGSLDHAMTRVAAIQLRALALALDNGVRGECALSTDLEISNEDAALALGGIATILDVGFELADDLRLAQDQVAS